MRPERPKSSCTVHKTAKMRHEQGSGVRTPGVSFSAVTFKAQRANMWCATAPRPLTAWLQTQQFLSVQ
jgi:hypothetical protein